MHDPMTVAWEICLPLPWRNKKFITLKNGEKVKNPYRRFRSIPIVTIWHNDPCTDGSDDSCSVRKQITKSQRGVLEFDAAMEVKDPWFMAERSQSTRRPADAETLLRGVLWQAAQRLGRHRWSWRHKRIRFEDCARLASELLHNPVDNVRSSLCLLPGWHTNEPEMPCVENLDEDALDDYLDKQRCRSPDDFPLKASPYQHEEHAKGLWFCAARIISRETARWWTHPRWHIHHWSFQVHPWQRFKRRFIDRCTSCLKRFKGGPVYSSWDGVRKSCEACHRTREMAQPSEKP